jgi:hypothetical protein
MWQIVLLAVLVLALSMAAFPDSSVDFIRSTTSSNGLPNGVMFNGTFSGPTSWTLFTPPNGTRNYTLTGVPSGYLGGFSTHGVPARLTINMGQQGGGNDSTQIADGDSSIVVPEPGTLGLLGTGLVGIAGLVRHKLKTE